MDDNKLIEFLHWHIAERKGKHRSLWFNLKPMRITRSDAKELLLNNTAFISHGTLYGFLIRYIGLDVFEIIPNKDSKTILVDAFFL